MALYFYGVSKSIHPQPRKYLVEFFYNFGILQILQNFKTSVVCGTLTQTPDIKTKGKKE